MSSTVRVWDLPTRIFHWALVVFIVGSITTAQVGGAAMVWHFRCGYLVLSLLLFRMIWGFVGGRWSRFASFVYSPATAFRYVRGLRRPEHAVGHNPLGAASVFAMLGVLLMQVASGLISDDEIAAVGPLAQFAPSILVNFATYFHKDVGKPILIALIVLHLGAIAFYYFKNRENLVVAMIHGDKKTMIAAPGARDDAQTRMLAAVTFMGCVALVTWMVKFAS